MKPSIITQSTVKMSDPHRSSGYPGNVLTSNRYVLGLALVFALGIPEILHGLVGSWGPWFAIRQFGLENSVVASALAIIAGHLSLQQMAALPLISARGLIVPTFLITFGAVTLGLFVFDFVADRYHLWTSALIVMLWYLLVHILRARFLRPVIGIIGLPRGEVPDTSLNITWRILRKPVLMQNLAAVVVDPHAHLTIEWSKFITGLVLAGVPVYHRAHVQEGLTGRVSFQSHAENNFGALLPSLVYLRVKRIVDLTGLVLALPFALPILCVAAIAIKLDGPGKVIFSQTRMGHRGQTFTCYKLRTMASDVAGPAFTIDDDPRISRVGRFLRKWRIDELPQMLNILKGEMSWIGPRPEALSLAKSYAEQVPFYDYRHAVRPGISGWAAVHQGNVALVDAATVKLEYDFFYIKYFSFWLDFLIVLKTVQTVWTGFGSR